MVCCLWWTILEDISNMSSRRPFALLNEIFVLSFMPQILQHKYVFIIIWKYFSFLELNSFVPLCIIYYPPWVWYSISGRWTQPQCLMWLRAITADSRVTAEYAYCSERLGPAGFRGIELMQMKCYIKEAYLFSRMTTGLPSLFAHYCRRYASWDEAAGQQYFWLWCSICHSLHLCGYKIANDILWVTYPKIWTLFVKHTDSPKGNTWIKFKVDLFHRNICLTQ